MQAHGLFSLFPIWVIFVATLVLVQVSVEIGYRRARFKQRRAERGEEQEKEAPVGAMVGATLGLLAFLLAITFGIAADGFHDRKVALLEEASAVQGTYLRAELIVEPQRSEIRKILREYVDARLQWAGVERFRAAHTSEQLLEQLGKQVAAAAKMNEPTDVFAQLVDSANDVIKVHDLRTLVRERSRIPGGFWAVLYIIAILSLAAMGYHSGVAGTARSPVTVAVAITFSLVIGLIVDIDRPGEGWINVNQEAMLDLQHRLAKSVP
jgi:hypothetical protein